MSRIASMCLVLGTALAGQPADVDLAVKGVGTYFELYYTRAQRLLLEETVLMQPLTSNCRSTALRGG